MELGKWYKFKEDCIAEYIKENPRCNEDMVRLISINGGAFSPTRIQFFNGDYYVEEATALNGKRLTCQKEGEEYFEVCGDEFKFFEEMCSDSNLNFKNYGPVNSANAETVIRLIAKEFLNKQVNLC